MCGKLLEGDEGSLIVELVLGGKQVECEILNNYNQRWGGC